MLLLLHHAHVEREDAAGSIVQLLLLELGQRHVRRRGHRFDGLHDAHAGRGGMPLRLQEGIVYVHARRVNGHIATSARVVRSTAGGATARGATARGDMASGLVYVVLQLSVHAQEVLLDMIGAIELLEAGVALEGLLVFMDVLVPGVQIPSVRRVRTVGAGVSLLNVHAIRGRGGCCLRSLLAAASAAASRGAGAAATAVAGR